MKVIIDGAVVIEQDGSCGNIPKFLKKRGLWHPGVIVESFTHGRQEVVRNPHYGTAGPIVTRHRDGKLCRPVPGGRDPLVVPEGKFLGEHYGHTPFTLKTLEAGRGAEKRPEASEGIGPRVQPTALDGSDDEEKDDGKDGDGKDGDGQADDDGKDGDGKDGDGQADDNDKD